MMVNHNLSWGIVKIIGGEHGGRIGYYDDNDSNGEQAIIYFGSLMFAKGYHLILREHLAPVTTADLAQRRNEIFQTIGIGFNNRSYAQREELLTELSLIDNELYERLLLSRFQHYESKKKVFISHSSLDKGFVRMLATDLAEAGHAPWLDEWKIRVGESIPLKISEGIKSSDVVVVVLSEHAVSSRWVENEWHAKYWDEITEGRIRVLPILLRRCEIPTLLKHKKYADFTGKYNDGLADILTALSDE
jgi:hypothetical protein